MTVTISNWISGTALICAADLLNVSLRSGNEVTNEVECERKNQKFGFKVFFSSIKQSLSTSSLILRIRLTPGKDKDAKHTTEIICV